MSPTYPPQHRLRRLAASTLAIGVVLTASPAATRSARADPAVAPAAGSFTIDGTGYGHGHGMSQYGAYGTARRGLSYQQILAFYYPGIALRTMSSTTTIKVWITADDDNSLRVLPAPGLTVSDAHGHRYTVPTGSKYRSWRIKRAGSGYRLGWKAADGHDTTVPVKLDTSTWSFSTRASVVKVRMPSLSTREYRGSVALVKSGSGARTVNRVRLEDYVRSVVPAEMPTSWSPQAVRAQAVAARSYAIRARDYTNYPGYDICDTTACQVYPGMAVTPRRGHRLVRENRGGDAAAKATRGTIVTYRGRIALTEFASSNGGAMARGGYPYLTAKKDPYDGVVTAQAWTRTLTVKAVGKAYPSVGTVARLQVTSRDGSGAWGGRVRTIRIIGSKKTVSVSGSAFQYRFGMRSSLYRVTRP